MIMIMIIIIKNNNNNNNNNDIYFTVKRYIDLPCGPQCTSSSWHPSPRVTGLQNSLKYCSFKCFKRVKRACHSQARVY